MPKYYGVKCLTCGTPLILGLAVSTDLKQMPMYAAPLDPIPCPDCGGNHLYSSDDVFEFEAEIGKSPFHPI
jgi:hypothetical protein